MPAFETTDPIQGFDVEVYCTPNTARPGSATSGLVGVFTSLMFKVVNQTETYLPLNQRIARQLDGELIFVWAAEQGLVAGNFLVATFGQPFADGIAQGRGFKLPRSERFDINFKIDTRETEDNAARFENPNAQFMDGANKNFTLKFCRVDTYSFGVTAGRHVVANSWQGTSEGLAQDLNL